jgi:acylphosphatase
VGFRWWTAKVAETMGLGGWVRNLPDGSVELEVWGEPSVLDRLEAHLSRGPRGARVEGVIRGAVPDDAPLKQRFSIVG